MKSLDNRIPPPVVALITMAIMWAIARTTYVAPMNQSVRYVAATLLVVSGVSIVLVAMSRFRVAGTTINPVEIERASSLVTSGIFRFTRNPMYVGVCTVLIGFAVWLSAPIALLGPIMFVWFITQFQIRPEERAMHALFGNAYDAYCRSTRRWL